MANSPTPLLVAMPDKTKQPTPTSSCECVTEMRGLDCDSAHKKRFILIYSMASRGHEGTGLQHRVYSSFSGLVWFLYYKHVFSDHGHAEIHTEQISEISPGRRSDFSSGLRPICSIDFVVFWWRNRYHYRHHSPAQMLQNLALSLYSHRDYFHDFPQNDVLGGFCK